LYPLPKTKNDLLFHAFYFMFIFSHIFGHLVAHHQPLLHSKVGGFVYIYQHLWPSKKNSPWSKVRVRSILLMRFCMFSYKPPLELYRCFWTQACVWWWANLPYLTKLEKKTLNLYHYLSSPTKQTFRGEAITPKGHESKRHQRLRWEGFYGQSIV
jgi:hypothetical protein